MTIAIMLPLFVMLLGGLGYLLIRSPTTPLGTDLKELARLTFFVGLLWLVYAMSGKTLKF